MNLEPESDVLDGTRALIHDLVLREPGISKSMLCREANLAWGTVDYHVNLLLNAGLLNSARRGNTLHLVAGVHEPGDVAAIAVEVDPVARRLLAMVADNEADTVTGLARAAGLNRKRVSRLLSYLTGIGLVRRTAGRKGRYSIPSNSVSA